MEGHSAKTRVWQRLRGDFRLAIITLFGTSTALIILPFGFWRFATGHVTVGIVDASLVACMAATVVYAWRSGNLAWPAALLAVSANAGCLAMVYLQPQGLLWLYPTLLANYFLLPRVWAVALSLVALAVVVAFDQVFASRLHELSFLASGSLVTLFSFIFASRTEAQHRKLKLLASQDALTGAHNRRAMEEALERATAAHRRHPHPVGLAIMDLDHFKRVNDSAGHEAGDRVLQSFADLVRANTRMADHLFRYGGEEFVLLLPGANAAALHGIGDKLRDSIAAGLQHDGVAVTVSIGAAELRSGDTWQEWLGRADAALYRAKQGGRNRVEVAPV